MCCPLVPRQRRPSITSIPERIGVVGPSAGGLHLAMMLRAMRDAADGLEGGRRLGRILRAACRRSSRTPVPTDTAGRVSCRVENHWLGDVLGAAPGSEKEEAVCCAFAGHLRQLERPADAVDPRQRRTRSCRIKQAVRDGRRAHQSRRAGTRRDLLGEGTRLAARNTQRDAGHVRLPRLVSCAPPTRPSSDVGDATRYVKRVAPPALNR